MLHATIMAGGAGTRFWPASRQGQPKQLLKLAGDRSMLQATVDRLDGLCESDQILVVTNQALVDPVATQLPDIPRSSIIGEPAKRDTAPCIALAASLIVRRDPEATMIVMPADHLITPVDVFQAAIRQAVELVEQEQESIVTLGIQPTYAAEVYGYIERVGTAMGDWEYPTFPVSRFREKPDAVTAGQFLEAGTFYWNSGIFLWKAKTILKAIKHFEPGIYEAIEKIGASIGEDDFEQTLQVEFPKIEGKSIDFAVMERFENVLVIEAPFAWDDLGNWSALPRVHGSDENGNTLSGKTLAVGTRNCIIHADESAAEHLLVTLGIENCIVVHTPNATLVANRDDESAIKQIVQSLEQRGWKQYL
ncbi:MAG: mannose-1-phosphate guanylyltransferase [Planctomycetota bacterium]|nr:mannose-1-phosphate guanylyltransferase [Planctomycetota bacterium]